MHLSEGTLSDVVASKFILYREVHILHAGVSGSASGPFTTFMANIPHGYRADYMLIRMYAVGTNYFLLAQGTR